jgi:hypothetical protein
MRLGHRSPIPGSAWRSYGLAGRGRVEVLESVHVAEHAAHDGSSDHGEQEGRKEQPRRVPAVPPTAAPQGMART